jgi:hypothetical protein
MLPSARSSRRHTESVLLMGIKHGNGNYACGGVLVSSMMSLFGRFGIVVLQFSFMSTLDSQSLQCSTDRALDKFLEGSVRLASLTQCCIPQPMRRSAKHVLSHLQKREGYLSNSECTLLI